MILADVYTKGITEDIDWNLGYEAVVKDAEEEPFDWCCNGRGGLDSWKAIGYIPVQDFDFKGYGTLTRSISRTLEYSANDFVISQIAKGLGKNADAEKYLDRSSNWRNLFNSTTQSILNSTNTGFVGYFQPRYLNGTWGYQDPFKCSQVDPNPNSVCSLQNNGAETFESSVWEYGFFVPHDQGGLMKLYNGRENFINRLTFLHDGKVGDIGNEPSFLTVFQFHYGGRPGLSAKRVHYYVGPGSAFTAGRDGIPGNDDSGAMGSFVAFCMMGLFPNPGQNVYLITAPFFKAVSITSPLTNKTATIRIENFDPTYQNIYIQNATLNGANYTRNWLTHDFFLNGGELILRVGLNESLWGTRVEDLPPSLSDYPAFNSSSLFGIASLPPKIPRGNNATYHRPTQVVSPKPKSDGGYLGKTVSWLSGPPNVLV
jgi:putative alpha-1,2-mannosidase